MKREKVNLSFFKVATISLAAFALALYSLLAISTLVQTPIMQQKVPYLYSGYIPYRQLAIVGACIAAFALLLLLNKRMKRKWLSSLITILVIVALCNPVTLVLGCVWIPECVNDFTIANEADFHQCADDMAIDFENFPEYNEFSEQNVQFVGQVCSGFFFYQSISAIVTYDSLEACEADYAAYVDSHQFLSEPVMDRDGDYRIAAPAFYYDGIYFKVLTAGEEDDFPKRIYMVGIDRECATLYYLYLEDHDLDYIAEAQTQDLEGAMADHVAEQYNLGK